MARIEAGTPNAADFDLAERQRDIAQRLRQALIDDCLGHLDLQAPASRLSGGEARRVVLIGALLGDADFLILDEPSNHLDRPARQALYRLLSTWPRGLLVISHDRTLLDGMERIVELTPQGLHSHGGNYSFYHQAREAEQLARQAALDHARTERKRGERELQLQRERQQRRSARGKRSAHEGNQARILLDAQKERSQVSSGKFNRQVTQQREQLANAVHDAAHELMETQQIALHHSDARLPDGKRVLSIEELALPFGNLAPLNLSIDGPQRIAISGPNGSGKSTLLKVIAGLLPASAGSCQTSVAMGYLDQGLGHLNPGRSALELLREANPSLGEGEARTRLAHIGLVADKALHPSGSLSGGERVRLALACALGGDPPAQLLLLDEPENHLDLDALAVLEQGLRNYQGALIVVSHDERFVEQLQITHRLDWPSRAATRR
jgi:ATPase subunit of ABC transporter with duplicated ATPase domains